MARTNQRLIAAALIMVGMLLAAAEGAEPDESKSGYASPEKVWEAFQKATQDRDGKAALRCVTDQFRDAALYRAWCDQFSEQTQPKSLARFIDEKKRLRLTRERLPVLWQEMWAILLECIENKPGAYAAVIAAGPSEREAEKSPGTLGDVSIKDKHDRLRPVTQNEAEKLADLN